jgi:phospholipid/cholesterol/gamma-HCH transport system substrate-binding protein
MKSSKIELLVGVFVLLGAAAIVHLSIRAGSGKLLGGETYLIESRFANAGGINSGSSVMLSGVSVGRVEDVRMEPSDFSAIVTLRLPVDLRLPTDSMASIKTTGLIGDKFIALSPGAEEIFLEPGARIVETESAVDLESLIGKMAFGAVDKNAEKEDLADESLP